MKLVFSKSFSVVLLLVFITLEEFSYNAQILPEDEVEALKQISTKLQIPYWKNIDQTSCNRSEDLNATTSTYTLSKVVCDCSYNSSTICHITNM
ncbi:hypothetical protein MKW98_008225 [Papaver atlanticum]|uniref:Uncharacterized protein n=1 Tax=Papaver atlanticum TaxID=357466 RepID=A0AAD4RWU6_9MAGN|nr:hypothetical protein MKW98_008225 [Papaver atlanticum]